MGSSYCMFLIFYIKMHVILQEKMRGDFYNDSVPQQMVAILNSNMADITYGSDYIAAYCSLYSFMIRLSCSATLLGI